MSTTDGIDPDALLGAAGLDADEIALIRARRRAAARPVADGPTTGLPLAIGLAVLAGAVVHAVRLGAEVAGLDEGWLLRNAGLLLAPGLVALLALRRSTPRRTRIGLAAALAGIAVAANAIPHRAGSDTELLAALHLPVLAWGVVLLAHVAGASGTGPRPGSARLLDAVRATGEMAVLYVLFALGGVLLLGLAAGLLGAVGIDAEPLAEWVLPAGAAGAVVIAGWVVETRPRLAAGPAEVLAQVFTPLLAVTSVAMLGVYAGSGRFASFDRDATILLDLLLLLVLAVVAYGQAARGDRPTGWADRLRLVAVAAASVLDLAVLATMASRLAELGATPNRVVALGLNLVLLIGLGGVVRPLARAVRGRGDMGAVERRLATVVPLLVAWAALVTIVVPPAFRFA